MLFTLSTILYLLDKVCAAPHRHSSIIGHSSDVTWTACSLKSPTAQMFLIQAKKENVKAPHYALLAFCEGNPVVTSQRASNAESVSMSWRHYEVSNIHTEAVTYHVTANVLFMGAKGRSKRLFNLSAYLAKESFSVTINIFPHAICQGDYSQNSSGI